MVVVVVFHYVPKYLPPYLLKKKKENKIKEKQKLYFFWAGGKKNQLTNWRFAKEFEIENGESLDTSALSEIRIQSWREGEKNAWRTEEVEEGKSVEMVSKAVMDSREIAERFITPTLLPLPSLCFPINGRQIHAREHPYTSLYPPLPPPPFIYLWPYSSTYEF